MALKVLGLGDNVVDKYLHTKTMYPGGNALNFAVYAKMLGASSSYMGTFGDDEAAAHIQDTLKTLQVPFDHARYLHGENGYACIDLKDGDRVFIRSNKGGVARENPWSFSLEDLSYMNEFDLITTSINSHLNDQLERIATTNAYIAYDFSIVSNAEIFEKVCPNIDFAIISAGHLSLDEMQEKCAYLHQLKTPYVIASRGKDGSLFSDGKNCYMQEAKLIQAVDTLGAGDSFLTCFLLHFVEGLKNGTMNDEQIKNAMVLASEFASKTCLVNGAFGYGKAFD